MVFTTKGTFLFSPTIFRNMSKPLTLVASNWMRYKLFNYVEYGQFFGYTICRPTIQIQIIEVMQVTSQALVRWRLIHFRRKEAYPTIAPPAVVPLHVMYLVQIRTCASVVKRRYCVIPVLSYYLCCYHGITTEAYLGHQEKNIY